MKKKRLVPCVEIRTPRRKHSQAFSPESSSETEPASPNLSPAKKRRLGNDTLVDGLITMADRRLALRESPTVSEMPIPEEWRLSPTVSDMQADAAQLSPTVSDYFLHGNDDDAETSQPDMSYLDGPAETVFYDDEDDFEENENLEVEGETGVDEDDSDYDSDDAPIRILDDFSIYKASNHAFILTGQLTRFDPQKENYVASGRVRPHSEEIDDYDGNDGNSEDTLKPGERVKLSRILEFNVHHFKVDEDGEYYDRKIYIRTEFAWYILASPSIPYTPFFLPFFVPHQICHMYLSNSLTDPQLTLEDFLSALPNYQDTPQNDIFPTADDLLERPIVVEDVKSDQTLAYLLETLPGVLSDSGITRLKRVPLIAHTLGFNFDQEYREDEDHEQTPTATTSTAIASSSKPAKQRKQSDFTPVVTPIVKAVAEDMFYRPLQLTGKSLAQFRSSDSAVRRELKGVQLHHEEDPESMTWGPEVQMQSSKCSFYQSVELDGVQYTAGEVVMVHYDEGSCKDYKRANNYISEASHSVNSYANRVWFCQIQYFFERAGEKLFHGQWLHHGSKTILQETAHSRGLFLGEHCDNVNVAAIFRKCAVQILEPGQDEPHEDKSPNGDEFFCSSIYDEEEFSFLDLPRQSEVEELLKLLPPHKPCHACALKVNRENFRTPRRNGNSVTYQDIVYHLFDFVYVRPSSGNLLDIAQIIKFDSRQRKQDDDQVVRLRYLIRYDDFKERPVLQERRLVLGREHRNIPFSEIDGKCFVKHLEDNDEINQWIKHQDHYFLRNKINRYGMLARFEHTSFRLCEGCLTQREKEIIQRQEALNKHGRLRGLELFSGAGGLGTGLDMSDFVDTKWAVEFNGPAARSYQRNHPDVIVFCQDSNALLDHAIQTDEGKKPPLLPSNFKGRNPPCQKMPRKGEVDIIYGGPPCQAFSRANHVPKVDDLRSTLPTNMLSYLEWYQPDYFLLENVTGLFGYSCKATLWNRRMEGGIKMGMVKLIIRALIALGYQARFKILQAGQYGCPQNRQRIIFWGCRRGLKLPNFPVPTHAFAKPAHIWNLPIDTSGEQKLYPASRCRDPDPQQAHPFAPLKPVTVNQAVGDLPAFEWINPHQIIRASQSSEDQADENIIQYSAVLGAPKGSQRLPGYLKPTSYAQKPCNAYQRWLRTDWTTGHIMTKVTGHYTPLFNPHIVEASTTVPLKPLADDKDLPRKVQLVVCKTNETRKKEGKKQYPRYGRLDGESYFKTALTTVAPNLKSSYVLHPSQRRVITYREGARAQGFPDHYEFLSEDHTPPNRAVKDIYKQIGNAVPVPMAYALGLALGDALMENWKDKERDGSPEL